MVKLQNYRGLEMLRWIKLTERLPNPEEHEKVLIYTEGFGLYGSQVFDVKSEFLNKNFFSDPSDQPEIYKFATHWMPHPSKVI
jgi:hypothetical protein